MNKRSLKFQEDFIKKNGAQGTVVSKSKRLRNRRYYLHKKSKQRAKVIARKKIIYLLEPGEITAHIKKLQTEFGYSIQTKII